MKKIVIATLALVAGIGTTFAQQPANTSACCPNGNNAKQCDVKGRKACAPNPFEGLNLTAEQQTKVDALKAECKAGREKAQADKKADRQKQRNDRADARKAQRTEVLAKGKAILTPEQYVQFLENNFVNGDNAPQGAPGKLAKNDRRKADKGQRPARKGDKAQQTQRPESK